VAQATPEQLVQEGVNLYKSGNYRGAIPPWKTALTQYQQANDLVNSAIVLENLARVHQRLGQTEDALRYWEQAIAVQQNRKNVAEIGRLVVEQAQVYSQMGQPRQAIALLCNASDVNRCSANSAIALLKSQKSPELTAAFGSLGEAYRFNGENKAAIAVLNQSLTTARAQNQVRYQMTTLNSLGNAYISVALRHYQRAESAAQSGDRTIADTFRQRAQTDDRQALDYLQQARKLAQTQAQSQTELRSLLSILPIHSRLNQNNEATSTLNQALAVLKQVPESRDRIYAAVDLVRLQSPRSSNDTCSTTIPFSQAESLLTEAVAIAQRIDDQRAKSFINPVLFVVDNP
jgi:tetratricopeptide (TPR) repeat protein